MTKDEAEARFAQLRGYLEQDPDNVALATDCADAALAADRIQDAAAILAPHRARAALDARGLNIAGLAAMRSGDQAAAQAIFEDLLAEQPRDEALRFNLAWSRALADDHEGAQQLFAEGGVPDLPQAAMLDLQLHHQLGEFDAAEEKLADYLMRYPGYPPLQAAASVLAMDIDRPDLARACAEQGGEHPDALATLGALELGERNLDAARELFERSLTLRVANPRANIGYGLVAMAAGDSAAALPYLDRGAEQFGDHLGSWLASGWAYLLAGDAATARARFETALAHDASFGEAQGSLAALDALAGDFDAARQRSEIALRLDRQSFSAAFASMLIAAADGDSEKAQRIFEIASRQALTPDGKSLADILAGFAL